MSFCSRLLLVVLTLSISACLTITAIGLVRTGVIKTTSQFAADQLPLVLNKASFIQQAVESSGSSSARGAQIAEQLLVQNNAMLRELLIVKQNVTALTQAFIHFIDLLETYGKTQQ